MIRALPVMAQKQADAAAAVVERRDGSVRGLRDAALLAVMSDGLLRVSEAAALEVADLEAEDANTLTIRRSKTDQEAEGAVQYIGEPTVARVRAWLDAAGIAAGPLFQGLDRAGRPRGRLSTVSHPGHRPATRRRGRDRGPRVRPLATEAGKLPADHQTGKNLARRPLVHWTAKGDRGATRQPRTASTLPVRIPAVHYCIPAISGRFSRMSSNGKSGRSCSPV